MDRVLLGKHDISPVIKEVEIVKILIQYDDEVPPLPTETAWTQWMIHNPDQDNDIVQDDDILVLPSLSDGTVQQVRVGASPNLLIEHPDPYTVGDLNEDSDAPNYGKIYSGGVTTFFTTPVLIDNDQISFEQSKNELWGKKLKLITYTERQQTIDVGLYVSRPGANVLDPVEARTGNLVFDSSLGTLKVLQRGTFQIQCKKTYMGKKGALELLSDEQNRANADYTKLYPFEVPQQSETDFLANSPKNANTILLGYEHGQYPQTGNGFNQEFIQNVYCDYGTTTVVFNPPLPGHIKNPHVSLHFAVANSSGHFHPWYANVECTTGDEDYGWQYANSQHCVHMDSAWFRGKWSFRERTIAPFGTNLNNDFRTIDPTANVNLGRGWANPDGDGIPTFLNLGTSVGTSGTDAPTTGWNSIVTDDFGRGTPPNAVSGYNSTINPSLRGKLEDSPSRPFNRNYGDSKGNAERYITDNQLGFNLPRYANPTIVPESTNHYPVDHPWAGDAGQGPGFGGTPSWKPTNRYTNKTTVVSDGHGSGVLPLGSHTVSPPADLPKGHAETLLGLVDPVLFNAEAGSPGTDINYTAAQHTGIPPEGAVKGSEISSEYGKAQGMTHGRARPPYYDPITGNPRTTSSGEGIAGLHTYRHEQSGPQSYESTLSMNSPYGVWGGAFKSFAGMQGITYFANTTHLKIDAFMTPTHSPTPFETEIVKTREVNPDAAHGDSSKFDWLGAKYLGNGITPNQEFDEFGNIRKNVGLAVDTDQDQPRFRQKLDNYKKYFRAGISDGGFSFGHPNASKDRDWYADTQSDGLGYSWSNVVHRAVNSGYGLPYKEKLPRMFRTIYWDDATANTEYEWWPINHANGHFTIAYGTETGGRKETSNSITSLINEYDDRTHDNWRTVYNEDPSTAPPNSVLSAADRTVWLDDQQNEKVVGSNRANLEAQFLDESREMGFDDEDLKLYRGHPVYMAACYGDYRPIAFIGVDSDSGATSRGKNFVLSPYLMDKNEHASAYSGVDDGRLALPAVGARGGGSRHELLMDNTIVQLRDSKIDIGTNVVQPTSSAYDAEGNYIGNVPPNYGIGNPLLIQHPPIFSRADEIEDQDEWSPFWPLLNKGTRFSNQLPNTEGKGYPPNSQYEPGDAFLKTRTFQGQPTSLDSFWNSFSNNTSQWVSSNTPYGEFYYADGGYAMDVSPYYNYGGQRYIYSAEKVEQRRTAPITKIDGSSGTATHRMMKLIPTDFNIQRQSLSKHNWHGGNPKAGIGTEGRRFGFGGAGSAEAIGDTDAFDTYIGTYIVYDIEGGGDA